MLRRIRPSCALCSAVSVSASAACGSRRHRGSLRLCARTSRHAICANGWPVRGWSAGRRRGGQVRPDLLKEVCHLVPSSYRSLGLHHGLRGVVRSAKRSTPRDAGCLARTAGSASADPGCAIVACAYSCAAVPWWVRPSRTLCSAWSATASAACGTRGHRDGLRLRACTLHRAAGPSARPVNSWPARWGRGG